MDVKTKLENNGFAVELHPYKKAMSRVRTLGKGRRVFLHVNQNAPIAGKDGFVFPVMTTVYVGKAVGIKFIEDAYKNFDERGAQVRISYAERILFIG